MNPLIVKITDRERTGLIVAVILAGIVAVGIAISLAIHFLGKRKVSLLQSRIRELEEEIVRKEEERQLVEEEERRNILDLESANLRGQLDIDKSELSAIREKSNEFKKVLASITSWDDITVVGP